MIPFATVDTSMELCFCSAPSWQNVQRNMAAANQYFRIAMGHFINYNLLDRSNKQIVLRIEYTY